jgi:hypothetical protein
MEVHHAACDDPGSISSVTELKVLSNVSTFGVSLHVFAGTASSCGLVSIREESVSISVVLRGGEKVTGDDLLGEAGSSAADPAVGTAFFDVRAVSLVLCRFRLHFFETILLGGSGLRCL